MSLKESVSPKLSKSLLACLWYYLIILLNSEHSTYWSSLSLLILVIYVCLLFSWPAWLEVYQFYCSFQRTIVWFHSFSLLLSVFNFINFCSSSLLFSSADFGFNLFFSFWFPKMEVILDFCVFFFPHVYT